MNNFPSKDIVESIRKQYPIGSLVELVYMDDIKAPSVGTKGKVQFVDDTGTVFCLWNSGSHLGVVYGVDSCRKISD